MYLVRMYKIFPEEGSRGKLIYPPPCGTVGEIGVEMLEAHGLVFLQDMSSLAEDSAGF